MAESEAAHQPRQRAGRLWTALPYVIFSAACLAWSVTFILRSSTVSFDGRRYFSLFDDAMISMRYAWNLAHGHGLVWNIGERVEGYSNLLWTLVMAVPASLFDKPTAVLVVQGMGVALLIVLALLCRQLAVELLPRENLPGRPVLLFLAFACAFLYYPLLYWVLMGMETGLVAVMLMAALVETIALVKRGRAKDLRWLALISGLAYLTRADTAVFTVPLFAVACLAEIRSRRRMRLLAFAALMFFSFPLAQQAFRLAYYGTTLPLTYILKVSGVPLGVRVHDGILYVREFLQQTHLLFPVAVVAIVLVFRRERLVPLLAIAGLVLYNIYVGGDGLDYYRLMAPSVPVVLVGVCVSIYELAYWASRRHLGAIREGLQAPLHSALRLAGRSRRGLQLAFAAFLAATSVLVDLTGMSDRGFGAEQQLVLAIAVVLAFVAAFAGEWNIPSLVTTALLTALAFTANDRRFHQEILLAERPYQAPENGVMINTANALREVLREDATIGVIWAGTIPYYSSFRAIDYLGKNDPYVAHLAPRLGGADSSGDRITRPGHNKYDLDYSIGILKPTYSQDLKWGSDSPGAYATDYVLVNYGFITLYLRRGADAVRWDLLQGTR